LLEVLIAFALVAMCVLPLIYPHVAMLKSQNAFIRKVELDHTVNLIYARVLEKLYANTIPWGELGQTVFPVDNALLNEIPYQKPFYFIGSYNFFEVPPRFKPKDPGDYSLYLYKLTFNFLPVEYAKASDEVKKKQALKYQYDVFVVRDLRKPGTEGETK
jgi:hypothetical protein